MQGSLSSKIIGAVGWDLESIEQARQTANATSRSVLVPTPASGHHSIQTPTQPPTHFYRFSYNLPESKSAI